MAEKEYQIGDLVQLKSGGPTMTVTSVASSRRDVGCKWFSGSKLAEGFFPIAALQHPEPKERPQR